ncbi:MAG: ABC transporter permease [Candidatus Sulfobium sp.]|jgi:putative ABC transport system permease protein
MGILKVALIELIRRPGRNGLIVLAIVIAVALLTSLSIVSDSANTTILEVITRTGHTLTVRPAGVSGNKGDNVSPGTVSSSDVVLGQYIPESAVPHIAKIYDEAIKTGWEKKGGLVSRPGIGEISIQPPTWAPRLYEKTDVDGIQTIVAGVDFYKEYFVRFWWDLSSGTWPEDSNRLRKAREDEAVLGGTFASVKGLTAGSSVTVKNKKFNVVGVLQETNSADDYMVFIPLGTAQKIFNKEGFVSLLSVRAMCPKCPVGDAMVELNKKVTGITSVSQLNIAEVQFEFFNMLYKFLLSIVLATLAVGFFSIFNTVTGALYSRVKEIGLLKSVGASRFQLLRLFLYQHLILGLLGGSVGFLAGVGMAYILNSLLDIGAIIRISTQYFWIALSLGVVCSLVAIFYPAYKLSRIKITETFRTQWEV